MRTKIISFSGGRQALAGGALPNSLKKMSQLEANLKGLVGVTGISLSFRVCADAHRGRRWVKL